MALIPAFRALAAAGTAGVLVLAANAVSLASGGPALLADTPADAAGAAAIAPRDPITIAFAGDVHFEKQLAPVAEDPEGLASLKPYLAEADVTIVNLESAVTTGGKRMDGKQFAFRTPPSALTTLANAGVDVVSLANNHGVDFGKTGLADTLDARADSPVRMVGIGANAAEAYAPAVFTVDGVSIAVLAASQLRDHTSVYFSATETKPGIAAMEDPERILEAVRAADAAYDVVVVVPHWGVEKETCPSTKQLTAARALADAGADIIVGGHSHRVMGSGWMDDTYVGYGLGNFVWFLNTTFPGRSTGVLTVEIDPTRIGGEGSVVVGDRWTPLSIPTSGIPAPDPETAEQMLTDREGRLDCAQLSGVPGGAIGELAQREPAAASSEGGERVVPVTTEPRATPLVVDGVPIVSKFHPLAKSYVPEWADDEDGLHPDVRAAFEEMAADAKAADLPILVRSGYRSWSVQDASFKRAWAQFGEGARRYYAEAGHSEHQTGLALDLGTVANQKGYSFAKTPQAAWVAENAARYGFIIRYPEGKRDVTGVDHEPWHLRWVGVDLAAELAKTPGTTLEEHLGLVSP